ncbi:MAG: RluA family pseudouridine synthase [Fimbriimonadaceae bacterium]|nr:RluA family pseudouridine synthase [Fimbriimonadaceae bacterium]
MRIEADQEERLDQFLARIMPEHSRSRLVKEIQGGKVKVGGKKQKPAFRLEPGMQVDVEDFKASRPAHDLEPADIDVPIVFEDASMIVVDKPRGLATHPAASLKEPTLVNALLGRNKQLSSGGEQYRPGIVHRLDKATTGLLVVAKTDAAHRRLARQIEAKTAERRYFAVVAGFVEQERFTVEAPLARSVKDRKKMTVDFMGKPAITHAKRLERLDHGTLLAIRLETGRTHQIRVHLQAVGYAVLGDEVYAPAEIAAGPLQLHAAYLEFDHPETGERVSFYTDPPEDFLGYGHVERTQIDPF